MLWFSQKILIGLVAVKIGKKLKQTFDEDYRWLASSWLDYFLNQVNSSQVNEADQVKSG